MIRYNVKLEGVEDRLIEDLERTALGFRKLGEKYGVSGQAIFGFCQKKGIERPKFSEKKHTETCPTCQAIRKIASKPHSDFVSSRTIKEQLRLGSHKWRYHIGILRKEGMVSERFGRLSSRKAELAYQIYFAKKLPVQRIGKQVGLKNLNSVIRTHRALGWDIPGVE